MESLDEEELRRVCLEMSAAWEPWWDAALTIQEENPAVRSRAVQQPEDFGDAAAGMVLFFALHLHPSVLQKARAHCRGVIAFLAGAGDAVAPWREDPWVVNERDGEASERDDRLAQLEAENEDLRRALRVVVAAASAAIRSPSDTQS